MAIKTANEMFGDGTAGNPQVNIDLNGPPGFNANNRGVAFGEQVTSAIKNRTPYSLVLNDEDLNTRLADFEVRGLDGAYDLGTLGPAGGGRQITKDAGAVETVSTLATQYGDDPANAHFRANMSGDTVAGGTGFDAVSSLARPTAGFVDRVPIDLNSNTIIAGAGQSCTLNPAGAGANRIQLTGGGRWKLGTDTDLSLTFEYVEVTGAPAGENGIYVLSTFISDDTATFLTLEGTSPAFTASAGATATLFRRKFASAQIGGGTLLGSIFHGEPGDTGAVILIPNQAADGDGSGADNALIAAYRDQDGLTYISSRIDQFGRYHTDLTTDFIDPAEDPRWGLVGHLVNKSLSAHTFEAGFVYRGADLDNNYGFVGLTPFDDLNLAENETFNFTATADEVDVVGATTGAGFQARITKGLTLCQITTPSAQAGYYYVSEKIGSDTTVIQLRNLDGTAPSFPGAGSGTITFFSGGVLGKRSINNMDSTLALAFPNSVRPAMTLMGGVDASGDSGGLYIGVPFLTDAPPLVCYRAGSGIGDSSNDRLIFGVTSQGFTYSFSDFRTDGEFTYNVSSTRDRIVLVPIQEGVSVGDQSAGWTQNATSWTTSINNRNVDFGIKIPEGAVLTGVAVMYKHSGGGTNNFDAQIELFHLDYTGWDTVGWSGSSTQSIAPATSLATVALPVASNAAQEIAARAPTDFTAVGPTSRQDAFVVRVTSDTNASTGSQTLWGVRVEFEDPGPRNF